jgi:hypothetical protein
MEIAEFEGQIRDGNPDLQGLCRALVDWSAELRILQNEQRRREQAQRRERGRIRGIQDLSE